MRFDAETRAATIAEARDVIARAGQFPPTLVRLAEMAVWQHDMLEAARRACTAALKHVAHLKQWPITQGMNPTTLELVAAVEALQKQGEADHG